MIADGGLAELERLARHRLRTVAATLAERCGLSVLPHQEPRGSCEPAPTPKSVGDLELVATVADAVLALSDRVSWLEAEIEQERGTPATRSPVA